MTTSEFYITGGTLRADSPCYVERHADTELMRGLTRGEFCYVLTSRQMGKSSLMARSARKLRAQGVAVAVLDLTAVGQNVTPEQWYDGLAIKLGTQLKIGDDLEDFWQDNLRLGPCQRWFAALRHSVLPALRRAASDARPLPNGSELVIFIDELDAIRSLSFSTEEFFAALREIYCGRAEDPELGRIAFCLLGVAAPHELMKDPKRTPFTLGHRIELADFTPAEARALVDGFRTALPGCDEEKGTKILARVLHWTNGHPYLTQSLCRAVVGSGRGETAADEPGLVDQLSQELFFSSRAGEADDNLVFVRERLLRTQTDLCSLLELYERVLAGDTVRDDPSDPLICELLLAGVVAIAGERLVPRNRIYERVFDAKWVAARKPVAELELMDGTRVRLKAACSLGRTDTNDVALPDVKVSRRHALIQKEGSDELWLVDLGSRNGTLLNGCPVGRPMLLRDRDEIDIGPYRLLFHQPKAPRHAPRKETTYDKTVIR